ncbi:hypothetical protein [Flammeovirga aprica]|uniref:YokE-like PH domain-containing protein n=1 Tax=Flammeovirga aprica JL-4 TaxID=694437 RepID=A0A7X9RZ02_9BACT|nr:hypothetical protein [Flammeovirga aprica]NME71358.1 hypothetical protein [Flammeovirga aprica JL-4]
MDTSGKQNWRKHFDALEVKVNGNATLEKVLDQIIEVLMQRGLGIEDLKAGIWASLLEDNSRAFGVLLLFETRMEYIGAIPGEGKLKNWEWEFKHSHIEKVEDSKLGIVRELQLQFNGKKFSLNGMKGFVSSTFIATLEKYWFKE